MRRARRSKVRSRSELQGDVTDRQVHFLLVQAYRSMGREQDAERHAAAIRALDEREGK